MHSFSAPLDLCDPAVNRRGEALLHKLRRLSASLCITAVESTATPFHVVVGGEDTSLLILVCFKQKSPYKLCTYLPSVY